MQTSEVVKQWYKSIDTRYKNRNWKNIFWSDIHDLIELLEENENAKTGKKED